MTINKIIRILVFVGVLLLIPLIAMQFTDEVNWDRNDFVIAGSLLLGLAVVLELIKSMVRNRVHRVIARIILVLLFLLLWAELGVGIFGTPIAGL